MKAQRKENRLLSLLNRDNVVLRLMECLTQTVNFDLFMDTYFTSFRLFVCFPTLQLTTFKQELCSKKIVYTNTLSSGTKAAAKMDRGHFEQLTVNQAKTLCNLCSWLERQHDSALHRFL